MNHTYDTILPVRLRLGIAALTATCAVILATASHAQATSYVQTGGFGSGQLSAPVGVAVDGSSGASAGDVYVANYNFGAGGDAFDSSGGYLAPPSPFGVHEGTRLSGIAVNPVNGDVHVVDATNEAILTFDSSGNEVGSAISVAGSANAELKLYGIGLVVQIASDSAGRIYFPAVAQNDVEVFSASGTLERTITGEAATVGAFSQPSGVAVDAEGDLYVADTGKGRVVRVDHSTGAQSVLTEGHARTVAVDPSNGNVYVGKYNGEDSCGSLGSECFHVVEYGPSGGAPVDDFAAGTIGAGPEGLEAIGEAYGAHFNNIAVSPATHVAYVSDGNNNMTVVFMKLRLPVVTTESATGVTSAEATLHGTVDPEGVSASYRFEYDTSPYGPGEAPHGVEVPMPNASLPEVSEPLSVSQLISGLEGSTTYHFRVVAESFGRAVYGEDQSFTTQASSPLIGEESFSGVTPTDAALSAQINPEQQATTYRFEYSTDSQLSGAIVAGEGTIAAGGQSMTVGPVDLGNSLSSGTTYYYRVVAEDGTGTTVEPIQSFITIGQPVVTTGAAGGVSRTSVVLEGTVNPMGAPTTYRFVYVDDARYQKGLEEGASDPYQEGWSTPVEKLASSYRGQGYEPSNYVAQTVGPVSVGGLLPSTTYHYALIASNEVGETVAQDGSFTTSPPSPPLLATGAASEVTANTAVISATIDTQGLQTAYGFEIGTQEGVYGPPTGLGTLGAGLIQTVTLELQNLSAGITYHYRVVASSVDGTSYGTDQSFTTPGLPGSQLTVPLASPLLGMPQVAFPVLRVGGATVRVLTRAQKLARALRACRRKPARAVCERTARRRYGVRGGKAKHRTARMKHTTKQKKK